MEDLQKETCEILHNNKIHWTIKLQAFVKYKEANLSMNLNQLAYQLNISFVEVCDYGTLGYFLRRYPNLKKIPLRTEAMRIIKNYNYDEKLLREKIKIEVLLNKTKLQQKEITKHVKSTVATKNPKRKGSKIRAEIGDSQESSERD